MTNRPIPEVLWLKLSVSKSSNDRNVATLVAWGALLSEQGKAALARKYDSAAGRTRALKAAVDRAAELGLSSSKSDLKLTKLGAQTACAGVRGLYEIAMADPDRAKLISVWASLRASLGCRVILHADDPQGWIPDEHAQAHLDALTRDGWIHTIGKQRRVLLTVQGKLLRRAGELHDLYVLASPAPIVRDLAPEHVDPASTVHPAGTPLPDDARRRRQREALASLVRSGDQLASLVKDSAYQGYVIDWESALDDCRLQGILP